MKKVLITGGAGFIGFHLANKISDDPKNDVTIIDDFSKGKNDKEFNALLKRRNITFHNLDLCNLEEIKEKIWRTYDQVYHLAAIVGVKYCMDNPNEVLRVNLKSVLNLLELVKQNKCNKILFASSCEVYASGYDLGIIPIPTDEKVPLVINDLFNPRLTYAASKLIGEQLIAFNSKNNYNFVIVRYHNIFGPRQSSDYVIPAVIKRIKAKENPFKVYGYNQTRSFCFIDDAVYQTMLLMEDSSANNEIYNVGNDKVEIKISELYEKLFNILDYEAELEYIRAPKGSVDRRCPDLSKIRSLKNFKPLMSFEDAIKATIDWNIKNYN